MTHTGQPCSPPGCPIPPTTYGRHYSNPRCTHPIHNDKKATHSEQPASAHAQLGTHPGPRYLDSPRPGPDGQTSAGVWETVANHTPKSIPQHTPILSHTHAHPAITHLSPITHHRMHSCPYCCCCPPTHHTPITHPPPHAPMPVLLLLLWLEAAAHSSSCSCSCREVSVAGVMRDSTPWELDAGCSIRLLLLGIQERREVIGARSRSVVLRWTAWGGGGEGAGRR